MLSQAKTQDLLLQNQSMRLVEESLDTSDQSAVPLAKVRYLQSVLPTPILGTAGVVLMFYFLADSLNRHTEMLVWLLLGSITTIWRSFLLFRHKAIFSQEPPISQISSYLHQTTATAVIAGLTFGWGWLFFYEYLSPEIQMGFLFTNILMLFGGLYAYSPHLPAYISFSVFSLAPALWQVQQNSTLWLAQTVGIALVALVSQMFAFRWAQNFRHNVLLQEKNAKLLAELTEKKEIAEKATRAKSRFLASVSHDLRQPLHAINLYLAVLRRSIHLPNVSGAGTGANPELTLSSLNNLQDSAIQLTRMFEALLDISKLDAGTTQASIAPVNVTLMIRLLEQEYKQLAAQNGLSFDVQLPKQIEHIQVMADAIMLERILRNLLSNATGHTLNGGVRLHLLVKRQGKEDRLEFRVVDTGPGIHLSDRVRIFEEFYQTEVARNQATTNQRASKNLGLGLAISSRLATLLKTRIRLYSYLGKGSVFAFSLGMHLTSPAQDTSILEEQTATAKVLQPRLQGTFIAVVDDEYSILNASQQLLESYGASVLIAESSYRMWQSIEKQDKVPDIFLIDYGLGKESGTALITAIKERYGDDKRCILITGDTSAEQVAKFNQAKLQVLYKPLTDDVLTQAIYKAVNNR